MTRCPRSSPRPPRRRRRYDGPASRLWRVSPRATPCRSANETAGRVLPWLSHVTRSGVSEPSLTLLGSRQWSRVPPFLHRSRTRAPSLRRRYTSSNGMLEFMYVAGRQPSRARAPASARRERRGSTWRTPWSRVRQSTGLLNAFFLDAESGFVSGQAPMVCGGSSLDDRENLEQA